MTEASTPQRNVEEINRWWPVIAMQACQDTQDVKVTNDEEKERSWSDDDEAQGNKVQSYVCVCLEGDWKWSGSVAGHSLDFLDMTLASHTLFITDSTALWS